MADGSVKWMVAMNGATIVDASIKKAAIGEAQIGNTHIDEEGISSNHLTSGTIRADQSIEVGNSHFILETLDASGRLRVVDTNGINRVTMGLTGLNRYGLIINDSDGNAVLDADGNIVRITEAAIEDLFVRGFKMTVPDASFVAAGLELGYSLWDTGGINTYFGIDSHAMMGNVFYWGSNETEIITLNYDPQGVSTVLIDCSFLYSFGRDADYEYCNYPAGDLLIWVSLYMNDVAIRSFIIVDRVLSENSSDEPDATYFIPKLLLQGTTSFSVQRALTEYESIHDNLFSLRVGYIAGNMRVKSPYKTVYNRNISVFGTRG